MAASSVVAIPEKSLWEIQDHLQALFDSMEMVEGEELRKEAEADIERYLEASVKKVDGIAGYLGLCKSQQEAAKAEIKRLQARVAAWDAREERVRKYVLNVMEKMEKKKLEGETNTFTLRAVPGSVIILEEGKIPAEFKQTTVVIAIDKVAIKKAITAGRDVPGADLSIGKQTLVQG